jgi:KaiC/GvpD/RAD55 family RecA-like ATPase
MIIDRMGEMKRYDSEIYGRSSVGLHEEEQKRSSSNFVTGIGWFDSLVPSGVPIPSSIVVTGPSGTGKPFIGLAFAGSWLRQGGRVIFIPIHSTYPQLFETGLRQLYGLSLRDYPDSHFFILLDTDLDPREESVEVAGGNSIRCNFLNPELWREAIEVASASMEGEGPILIFSCAMNLLLMSPTYGDQFFLNLVDTIRDPGAWTYLLTVSSSILLKKIIVLEQAADHLFAMKRVARDHSLHLRAAKVRDAGFYSATVPVAAMPEFIEELKNQAIASRRVLIPTASRV